MNRSSSDWIECACRVGVRALYLVTVRWFYMSSN
jgi:hypothetical protein